MIPNYHPLVEIIKQHKAIAVIRLKEVGKLASVIDALVAGGIRLVEITTTVPDAVEMIAKISRRIPDDVILGAGTILDSETASAAMDAGAEFIVGPTTDYNVIETVLQKNKMVIPGAFTPTEIFSAWSAGAHFVKVFPATVMGPGYLKDLRGPLPQIRLCPTGGVTIDNANDFIMAGAACIGIGTALVDKRAVADGDYDVLKVKARKLIENLGEG